MKKMISLLACVIILFSLCACGQENEDIQQPVNFYYCSEKISYNSPTGVMKPEIREGIAFQDKAQMLLREYLQGPRTPELVSPIPNGTKLTSFQISDNSAYIELSSDFASISGIKLSTACCCIAMTVSEYTGCGTVYFRVEDGQLDNKDEIVLRVSDIIVIDELH